MRSTIARGMICKGMIPIPKPTEVTIRTETTNGFSTLSLSDDKDTLMIQIAVTPAVKKVLQGVCK